MSNRPLVWIKNPSRDTLYIDSACGHLKSFSQAISDVKLRDGDYENYLRQAAISSIRPDYYLPIGGHYVAPPRTRWLLEEGRLSFDREDGARNECKSASHKRLLEIVRRYAGLIGTRRVAVELSGGLDSAIVIQLLRLIGVKPALVGFQSSRYEFRTERRVQERLMSNADSVALLDDDVSIFSNLEYIPAHPIPAISSLFYDRHKMIASAAAALGVAYVLSGVGGDSLFVDQVSDANYPTADRLSGWEFNDFWSQDAVYAPVGLRHYCAYSPRYIGRVLHAMRVGECGDNLKLWARREFRDCLPRELSCFAYKASHDGLYAAAIERQSHYLLTFMRRVYERCGIRSLSPESIEPILKNWPVVGQEKQQLLFLKLSFGVWINSNNLHS